MDICFKKQSKSLHMKALRFTLIFVIIGYFCVYTEEFNCQEKFDEKLKGECEQIKTGSSGSCSFFKEKNYHCVETNNCDVGGNDPTKCRGINPSTFTEEKCDIVGGTCTKKPKVCDDWDPNRISEIDCTSLAAPSNEKCRLVSVETPKTVLDFGTEEGATCESHYISCSTINDRDICNSNIPDQYSYKCEWDGTKTPKCQSKQIYCGDSTSYYKGTNYCPGIDISDSEQDKTLKKCIYKDNYCQTEYMRCEDRPYVSNKDDCKIYMPLNAPNYVDYDFSKRCIYNPDAVIPAGQTGYKCKAETRKCTDYNDELDTTIPTGLLNEAFCNKLATEDYQRCAYKKGEGCYEEYTTCENYTLHKVETDRDGCEGIILTDPNKKCVYDKKEDTCVTIEKYTKCSDYKGKDKKTCESILSSDTHQYCILDKDIECIEKPINCSEAYTKDICIKIAKPTDSNKRCAFNGKKCIEEFIRCEDFLEATSTTSTSSSTCGDIILYDGKQCEWVSTNTGASRGTNEEENINHICRSRFKTCEEATTKEECELIAKTGVTNPERKVCSWTGSNCIENYKYCSDFRGPSTQKNLCTRIKPYDESGNNTDIGSKCIYDDDAGCQRVPVDCRDADENPILCEIYSDYIKDNDKKYCFFNGRKCSAHYKKCEYFETDGDLTSCQDNVIQGSTTHVCGDDDGKCVNKYECSKFSSVDDYKELICNSIHPNCSYNSEDNKCEYSEKKCTEIVFYSKNIANKETCENMEASEPYKKCVLKEDQSGCEEVYRVLEYSSANVSYAKPPDASSEGNSSGFIGKGIHLIMAFLCLLI